MQISTFNTPVVGHVQTDPVDEKLVPQAVQM